MKAGVSLLAAGVVAAAGLALRPRLGADLPQGGYVLLVLAAAGITAAVVNWGLHGAAQRRQMAEMQAQQRQLAARMESVLHLNHSLVNAGDEHGFIQQALEILRQLTDARASTFVPMDEWGQPLTAYTQGVIPEGLIKGWAEHLASHAVQERCSVCQELQAEAGTPCPLLEPPFTQVLGVYCLPLRRQGRMLGLFSLYLPAGRALGTEERVFLDGLLNEIAYAIQTIRLRNQEINTIQQIQLSHGGQSDLQTMADRLVMGARKALEGDYALLWIQPYGERLVGVQAEQGWLAGVDAETVRSAFADAQRAGDRLFRLGGGLWAGAAVTVAGGQAVGGLAIGRADAPGAGFDARQLETMNTLAAQAAHFVETQRDFFELEYQAVMQERSRLAREIHDGLAQTLAFLKMQTSQMQKLLERGETGRLNEVVQDHLGALNAAYLETRQVIENLRLDADMALGDWLRTAGAAFESASGLRVETQVDAQVPEVLPEVRAQLVRIYQEALSNVRKHAGAQRVWVRLGAWEGDLILEVADDGRGFAPEDVPEVMRFGLRGMRERAEVIGADFQITSQVGQGTRVRLRLPRTQLEQNG